MIVTESETPTLLVCDSSHKVVLYSKVKLSTLISWLAMQEINIIPTKFSLDRDTCNMQAVVGKETIISATKFTSQMTRITSIKHSVNN